MLAEFDTRLRVHAPCDTQQLFPFLERHYLEERAERLANPSCSAGAMDY